MGQLDRPSHLLRSTVAMAPAPGGTDEDGAVTTVADVIVRCLEQVGVSHVFGIGGGAIDPLFHALSRSATRGGPRAVPARHEAGAAFMADGYARETGRIGVCATTSGPGATNLVTGIASAFQNGIPVLAITGQPALPLFGKNPLQDSSCAGVDTVAILRLCSRYSSMVSHVDQLGPKLAAALTLASDSPSGPVHLSFPVDILRSPLSAATLPRDLARLVANVGDLVDGRALLAVAALLEDAPPPVILVGGSNSVAAASAAIAHLAAMTGATVVSTPDGKGFVDPASPSYAGVFGLAGHDSAHAALAAHRGAILAFGTSFGELASGAWSKAVLNDRLVHFDERVDHLARSTMARRHVRGDIRANCERLIELLADRPLASAGARAVPSAPAEAPARVASERPASPGTIKPQDVMAGLSRHCTADTRFVADTGNSFMWAARCLTPGRRSAGTAGAPPARAEPGWLRMTMDFAAMGWGIGAAIGIARARPDRPVVCITGDGSYLMSGQEITVAQEEGLPVVVVVLNDRAYGMVMHGQRLSGHAPTACELPEVDYVQLAAALGVPGHRISSPSELDALGWDAILTRQGPTLLDVRIDRDEAPPMGLRLETLGRTAVSARADDTVNA